MLREVMSDTMSDQPGLRLLSLDNGGIKGLSSLYIIKEIMTRLQREAQRNQQQGNGSQERQVMMQYVPMPKPCDHFDIISGTGTGAICAVLLGRLRMGIEDAIRSYVTLMRNVFSDPKTMNRTTPEFKATVLETELKKIVKGVLDDENGMMMESYRDNVQGKCEVVVYAMSAHHMNEALPISFRSYPAPTGATANCTIWEALRATTTHADMFKPIEIDMEGLGVEEQFVHGGLGCSNPTKHILEEASQLYPGRVVTSIVSIGTGHPQTIQVARGKPDKVLKASLELAEGSERVAEEMARQFKGDHRYCRLNVQQGMQEVGASEWELMNEVVAHTRAYVIQAETSSKLETLVANLQKSPGPYSETSGTVEIYNVSRPTPEQTTISHPHSEVPHRRLTLTPHNNLDSPNPTSSRWTKLRGLEFLRLLSDRTSVAKSSASQPDAC
ncbi:hypothetical protein RSAG8_11903, partial [Rhizoctonia solani AG-8 WAC10335]